MIYRVSTSTIPIRAEPTDSSEMTNELLYGEFFSEIEKSGSWIRIRSEHDEYEGWIAQEYEPTPSKIVHTDTVLKESTLDLGHAGLLHLSPGSQVTEKEKSQLHSIAVRKTSNFDSAPIIVAYASQFLNTPYLWGGRSIWGIDCSGLMQIVFALKGTKIPRDAYQQAELGNQIGLDQIESGDFAFFNNLEGSITHVGIMVDAENILHASGRVRIDSMDAQGIIRKTDGKRTHALSCVRRF